MKTKLFLLALIPITLYTACSTGDDIPKMAYIAKTETPEAPVVYVETTKPIPNVIQVLQPTNIIADDQKTGIETSYMPLENAIENEYTPSFSEYIAQQNTTTTSFNVADGAIITCNKGSVIKIPANAFVYEDQTPVTGTVTVSAAEYSSKTDFIMAGLTSMSGNRMIESSGMYNITAEANGKNLVLKQDKQLTLVLPDENVVYSSTQVFFGSYPATQNPQPVMYWADDFNNFSTYENAVAKYRTTYELLKNERIITLSTAGTRDRKSENREYLPLVNIWVLRMPPATDLTGKSNEKLFFDVANKKTATFSFLKKPFINDDLYEPMLRLKEWDTLKMVVTIDETGKLLGTKATAKSLGKGDLDNVESILSNGRRFKMRKDAHDSIANYTIYCIKPGPETITPDLPKNEFTTKSLGWINCDRFLNSNRQLTTMELEYKQKDSTRYYCVFKNINSIMPAYSYTFPNVPVNEPVVIVGIQGTKENTRVFIQETECARNFKVGEFVPMKPAEMQKRLNELLQTKPVEQASTK